jgi:hypothetical protein
MFGKPMAQPILGGSRERYTQMGKTQGLADCTGAPCIRNALRVAAAKLGKRQRLARLISKTTPSLGAGHQMREAIAQDHRAPIKHALPGARCTPLLPLPPATFPWRIIRRDFRTLFGGAPAPGALETLLRGPQDAMVHSLLVPSPIAPPPGLAGHLACRPPMLHTRDERDGLVVA